MWEGCTLYGLGFGGLELVGLSAMEALELELRDTVPISRPELDVVLAQHLVPIDPYLLLTIGLP